MRFPNPFRALARLIQSGRVHRTIRRPRPRPLWLERLETRDVPAGTWTAVGLPPSVSSIGDMVLLADGEAMVQIAGTNQWFRLTPDASGNYFDGTWAAAAPMSASRLRFASNVLPDGQLVVMGGEYSSSGRFTSSAEVYNPASNTWTAADPFPAQESNPPYGNGFGGGPSPTELLPGPAGQAGYSDGQLLVGAFWGPDTWLFNPLAPAGSQWTQTGPKFSDTASNPLDQDNSSEESDVLLPDGTVLAYDLVRSQNLSEFTADRYFPSTGLWEDASQQDGTAQPLNNTLYPNHENGPGLLLPDGTVFWLGEDGNTAFFNLSDGTWSGGTATIPNGGGMADAPAAVLPNGNVLLAASTGYLGVPTTLYEFNPVTEVYTNLMPPSGSTTPYPDLSRVGGANSSMLVLPNGHVLFSAGKQLWDYSPDGPAPTDIQVGSASTSPDSNGNYTVTGTYLTGFSEGAAQGDEFNGSATNYPIVKLTLQPPAGSNEPARVWYCNTTGWTPGVDDSTPNQTAKFTLPADLPAGTFQLQVVASGIASNSISFTPTGPGPVYADSSWAGLSNNTPISDPDPLAPGVDQGAIGVNCFASVNAAISKAAQLGVAVVVNGADGVAGSGSFPESVAANSAVPLYLQNGNVSIGSLYSDLNDSDPAGENVIVESGSTLAADGDSGGLPYDGLITGPGTLDKIGSGTLTLGTLTLNGTDSAGATEVGAGTLLVNGSIVGLGSVTVDGGQVQLGSANALAAVTVVVNNLHGLNLGNFAAAAIGGLAGGPSGTIALNNTALTVGGDSLSTSYAGVLTSSPFGSLIKAGPGTLTLAGATTPSSSFFGAATVNGGDLLVTGSLAAQSGVAVNPGGELQPGNAAALQFSTITLNVDSGLNPNTDEPEGLNFALVSSAELGGLEGSGNLDLGSAAVTVGYDDNPAETYRGTLSTNASSPGSLIKDGSGTLTLSGDTSSQTGFAGGVQVNGGTLLVTGTLSAGSNENITVGPGGTLGGSGVTGPGLPGTGVIDGDVAVNGGTLQPGGTSGPLTIADSSTALTFTMTGTFAARPDAGNDDHVNVSGSANLTSATLSLTPTPGYAPAIGTVFDLIDIEGPPTINHLNGVFSNLPATGDVVAAGGQYFAITYTSRDATLMVVAPPTAYADTEWANLPYGTVIPIQGAQPAIVGYSAFATVNGALANVAADGTVVVNGADGTSGSGIFSTDAVNLPSGVTLELQQGPVTFESLAGGAGTTVALNGVALTTGGDNTDTTFDGIVTGTGGLTKTGTGTFTLGATNSYGGGTTVAGGVLSVASDGYLGTGNVTVDSSGTLLYTGTTTATRFFSLDGGTLSINSGDTLTLDGSEVTGGSTPGNLDGPGSLATNATIGAILADIDIVSGATVMSNSPADVFYNDDNDGTLDIGAGVNHAGTSTTIVFHNFTNDGTGAITIGAGAEVNAANFQTYGTLTLAPNTPDEPTVFTNVGTSLLGFDGGSQTFIGTSGTADPTGQNIDAYMDLHGHNAEVADALFVNNGGVFDTVGAGTATVISDYNSLVKGAGFWQNSVQTQNGGKFQTGNCPGSDTLGSLEFGPDGVSNYVFAIDDSTGVAGPQPDAAGNVDGWSLAKVQGNFSFTADATNKLTVNLQTLVNPSVVLDDVPGTMDNFDPTQSYSWAAVKWTGTYTGPTDVAALNAATNFDTSGFQNSFHGTFAWSLDVNADTLYLTYTPAS